MPSMSQQDKQDIIDSIVDALKAPIDNDLHRQHHDVIARWIENDTKRAARRDAFYEKVGGFVIIAVLGAVGTFVWQATSSAIKLWAKS